MLNKLAFLLNGKKPNEDIPIFCLKAGRIVSSADRSVKSESLA